MQQKSLKVKRNVGEMGSTLKRKLVRKKTIRTPENVTVFRTALDLAGLTVFHPNYQTFFFFFFINVLIFLVKYIVKKKKNKRI